uniref:Pre-C2HC domain-containing protein n=1 Tax=Clastoptera arizonana TaxID=38151 RepID=A0A1B6DRF3_9HEMI
MCDSVSIEGIPKCAVYITTCTGEYLDKKEYTISKEHLEEIIHSLHPIGQWSVSETSCGLIAYFSKEHDANELLCTKFDDKMKFRFKMAKLGSNRNRFRQNVILMDIPNQIPLQDISFALQNQDIDVGNIERRKTNVRLEITDPNKYKSLINNGLNFFDAALFMAQPEQYCKKEKDYILQCFNCQGFYHIAAHCQEYVRCVRCGDHHNVENCHRPRNDPFCCHCGGRHHAASIHCPVRQQLINATPVSITLSTNNK